MTREEAIKLMREAGFVVSVSVEHWGDVPFAKLCHPTPTSASLYRMLESLINRAVTHEREVCAKVCEGMIVSMDIGSEFSWASQSCATAIRARSKQ